MNAPRRLIRASAALAALAVGGVTLTACGGESAADDGKVKVAASFYPMEFLAKEIGGDKVSVTNLTKPGVEPHDLELTARQTGELSDADLVVYLKGLQPAVDEAVQQAGVEHVAEATSYTTLEKHGTSVEGDHEHEHGEEGHEHGEEGHEHAEGEEHGEEGHSHELEGGQDPHVWLDPLRYAEIAKGVNTQLAKADPSGKKQFQRNTDKLVSELRTLDKEFKDGLKDRTTDTFVTTHSAFGYFAERYGLNEQGIAGIDPESGDVSGARIKELQGLIKQDDVNTVFFEEGASDATAKTLAQDLELKTAVLSPLEVAGEGEDYFSVMRHNLDELRTALGTS